MTNSDRGDRRPVYRVVRAQGFGEGNERTALSLAGGSLDRNGLDDPRVVIAQHDQEFATPVVSAAAGTDVEVEMRTLLLSRG